MAANPYLNLLRTAWSYARHEKRKYLFTYLLFAAASITNACRPILYGWMIQGIQQYGLEVWRYAWQYAAAYLLLNFIEWALHGPSRVMERSLAFNLSRNFINELYQQALHLPVKWHQDNHSGVIINRIRKSYEALKSFFQDGFMFFYTFTKFIISFLAMLYFSPVYGALALLLGAITILIIFKFDKPIIETIHESNEREHKVSSTLFDSLSNINTVITLRLENQMKTALMQQIQKVWPPFRKNVVLNEWKWFVADTLVAITYVMIIMGYVYQTHVPGQVFYVGGLVTLIGYVHQFTSVFHDFAWQYNQIIRYNTDVLAVKDIQQAYQQYHPIQATFDLPTDWSTIKISNLNYTHLVQDHSGDLKNPGLKQLDIELTRGHRIAIIGESGGGKSTLLSVLRGLYPAQPDNTVIIDGRIMCTLDTLHDQVTLFPQDPEIFENTIHYNITLGLDYETDLIRQVCETVAFQEVVDQLPKGLESHIKEKGVNLSGGQKQRLALARGVLAAQGSSIVLMDEPTSSVDPKTELMVYQRLFELFKDKVVVSALHRLHLLEHFDYIYVMQDGRVVEEGSLGELKKNSTIFKSLWEHLEL